MKEEKLINALKEKIKNKDLLHEINTEQIKNNTEELEQQQEKIEDVVHRIESMQKQLNRFNKDTEQLEEDLENSSETIHRTIQQLEGKINKIGQNQKELAKIVSELQISILLSMLTSKQKNSKELSSEEEQKIKELLQKIK